MRMRVASAKQARTERCERAWIGVFSCSALGMVEMEVIERLFEEVRVKFRFEPRFCGVNLNETPFAHCRHSGAMQ